MIQRMNRHHRIRLLFVLAIFLLASLSLAAEPYQAKVVGISDGDTITVLHDGQGEKIRLYGIDTQVNVVHLETGPSSSHQARYSGRPSG